MLLAGLDGVERDLDPGEPSDFDLYEDSHGEIPQVPGAVMPFVPTGSDGSGPVWALRTGRRCVGIELDFAPEDED